MIGCGLSGGFVTEIRTRFLRKDISLDDAYDQFVAVQDIRFTYWSFGGYCDKLKKQGWRIV